jgi:hypothetical protein
VRQIGGIEGQSALLRELRRTRDPLETLILLAALGNVGHLPTLDAARVDAARRYLDGDPAPREEFFLTTLFDAIAIQESSRAAADLARFAAVPGRSATAVDLGLRRLADLPAEAAVPALAEVATGGGSDRTAELAADLLVGRTGQAVPPALSKVLAAAGEGVRRRIYQGIGAPVRRMVKDLENEGGRGGLQLLDRLAALESEVAARRKVLEGERREETKPEAFRDLDAARKSLTALAARTEELAGKFRR